MYIYKSKLGLHSFDNLFNASSKERFKKENNDLSTYEIEDMSAQEDHDLQATNIFEQQKEWRKRVNFKF
jgi:hypothetical protein